MATGNMYIKFPEIQTCGFSDMDKQTYIHAECNTPVYSKAFSGILSDKHKIRTDFR